MNLLAPMVRWTCQSFRSTKWIADISPYVFYVVISNTTKSVCIYIKLLLSELSFELTISNNFFFTEQLRKLVCASPNTVSEKKIVQSVA